MTIIKLSSLRYCSHRFNFTLTYVSNNFVGFISVCSKKKIAQNNRIYLNFWLLFISKLLKVIKIQ